jgi:hypothetical protein
MIVSAIYYFNFTAEDAYITYRYAENFVNTGSLVYNEGEPINAMTSPFHAMLSAALFYATGQTVFGNKILALSLLLVSALLVWYRFRGHSQWQLLALILMLMTPSVLLWTLGGLETPILLFLVTTTVLLVERKPPLDLSRLCLVLFLASLAFLTRYDSILFFLPVTLYEVSKARSIRNVVIAIAGAAVLPLGWLFISLHYYGDLLPTSFYVKTPTGDLGDVIFNGIYIASYLFYVGIIPVVAFIFILLFSRQRTVTVLYQHFKSFWWLYLGLFLEILYGLTMATHHMMFSFRFFVPYIPATILLVIDLLEHVSEAREVSLSTGPHAYLFTGFLFCLTLFQLYQNVYTYNHSVNGISLVGEYRALGIRDYIRFIQTLQQEARDIEQHWNTVAGDRPPRILTYAAGMLPYTYRDSYIYEKLVSYRHCHERYRQGLHADYIHMIAPRQGQVSQQLPRSVDNYYLVSDYKVFFDGSMQDFLVYYNPKPEEHNLSAKIYEPCELDKNARH